MWLSVCYNLYVSHAFLILSGLCCLSYWCFVSGSSQLQPHKCLNSMSTALCSGHRWVNTTIVKKQWCKLLCLPGIYRKQIRVCRKYTSTDYCIEDVPLVEFIYLMFPCMPGQSYHRRRGSLLYLCYIFQAISFFVPILNTPNSICSFKPVRHKQGILPANTPFPHFSNQLSKVTTRIRTRSHSTFNKQCDFCCCCCCCCCCFLCGNNH